MTFAATILTLYPEMFPGPLGISLSGDALASRRLVDRGAATSATTGSAATAPWTTRLRAAGPAW